MRSFLVVSKEKEILDALYPSFDPDSRVDQTGSRDTALNMLREVRYDLVFIDLEILRESLPAN
jgi:DNA-binding response OmpR family regulator